MSSLITSFADVETKEIQWLWNPYIALGKLTLAYGTKEVDLTDFMLRFTAALSTGGIGGLPCSILYFDSEKNVGWIKSKLQEYDADLTRISCIHDSDLSALLKAKDEICQAHISAIIINGLESLLFMKKATKASEINTGMQELAALAKETHCAILLGSEDIHPTGSVISRYQVEPIKRIPRSILRIERSPSAFLVAQEKNSIAEVGQPFILDDQGVINEK
jgi:DNA repair protein RadA/Sms